ncbi:MAG: domain S-box [Ignavibacteria bacterium]|nr:domain S-box [Ignavibacteria bacterium]
MNLPDNNLFDETPCFISVHDLTGKILKVNKLFKETFGDRVDDFCYRVYKQREEKCSVCPMDNIQHVPKIYTHEEVFFSSHGEPIHVLVNTSPVHDEFGNPIAVMEMAIDNSETKRLQRKFEENSEKYRTLYDEVPCYISVQDRNFRIIDSNKRFQEEFGGRRGDFCYKIYKHRETQCEICPVALAFEDGEVHSSEEIVASRTGEPINFLVYVAPLKDANGDINSVMEMSTNITQVRKMQSNLTTLGQVISGMAHSIKGIINGLDGGIYIVESGLKKNNEETLKKGWDMVKRNIDRISHLVLDMLYFVKDRIPELEEIDLNELCKEICEQFAFKCQVKKIDLKFSPNDTGFFRGDAKEIYTMVNTLIENAVDACCWDNKKEYHDINIKIESDSNNIYLIISDNGIGMSEETRSKLFSSMFSTKGNSGTGFGLMVVKKIVDEHGGEIYNETKEGIGTTFKIKLPRKIM